MVGLSSTDTPIPELQLLAEATQIGEPATAGGGNANRGTSKFFRRSQAASKMALASIERETMIPSVKLETKKGRKGGSGYDQLSPRSDGAVTGFKE
ncbi:hypothetical protein A2U01_0012023 [Trifolium medium]|uniref:Uncharacterized protein n=1 Tax=Trifolium medium TaxID=97028 RepID=A0A392MWM6_9FABA|nr:hypothetical protein [Trifolium medium]